MFLVGLLVLGPLAAVSAAYMNFKLGFFLGGSILSGVLGSAVAIWFGRDGRHGANYIQTLASAMGSMGGMVTIFQAAHWLGLEQPAPVPMLLFLAVAGLFGVGIGGMLTPLLVDDWKLEFPSGKAVADMLAALSDRSLLRRSLATLGGGGLFGLVSALPPVARVLAAVPGLGHFSAAIPGAGLIVGARIGLPGLVMALLGLWSEPWLRSSGRLAEGAPFRSLGYLFALAMIVGAALVFALPLLLGSLTFFRKRRAEGNDLPEACGDGTTENSQLPPSALASQRNRPDQTTRHAALLPTLVTTFVSAVGLLGLLLWLGVDLPASLMVLALIPVFVLANGISTGISDLNPISSAFVVSLLAVVAVSELGPMAMLLAGSAVLVGCSCGVDMQQDRSTGRRLGSSRGLQFWFQFAGVLAGAMLAPLLAAFFFRSFPELTRFPPAAGWESAMTLKIAGTIRTIRSMEAAQLEALAAGFVLGIALAVARRVLRKADSNGLPRFARNKAVDFLFDAVLLPTPFALSFGGFVSLSAAAWFAAGSVVRSLWDQWVGSAPGTAGHEPAELSGPSLLGGGLIAGETLAYVSVGLALMYRQLFGG